MNAEDSLKLARRFIGLPLEKRQMFLAALQKEGVDFARFPIPAGIEAEDRQALSYAQQRMWFLWQLDPHSGAYNLPGAVRLSGRLNLSALEQAFAALVARHETLRTVFQRQADDSLLQVPATATLDIRHEDFSALPATEREEAVVRAAEQQSVLPFDLAVGPLLRVTLLKLAGQEHVLLLTLHHIVSDGWSMNVLIDEFIRCYDAFDAGQPPALAALPVQYSDYALWQRRWLEAGEQARQLEYWQAQLGDEHPVLELPLDHSRPAMPSYRGTRYEFAVDGQLTEQLRATAQQHQVTLFMLLLGAFNALLHRYTGQTDIRVGVPIANRNRAEIEGLIGFFVNTQVLRTRLDGQTRVDALLQAIKETALGAQAHQDLPFEQLVEALKLERSLSHTPLFQVMYNHQPQVADIAALSTASGLVLDSLEWQSRTTQFDLTLDTYEKGGKLHAALTYASDLFDAPTIERMARHWLRLLKAMVADPAQRIGELPLLDADEQHTLVHAWNATAAVYPSGQPIHQLIEAQVARTPDAPALVFAEQTLSYAQLDARANQLAHLLREQGVRADSLVGICVERSLEMVIGLLAILKAGGAYVPLDPEYPQERLAYMVEDSGITLLLTQSALLASLPTAGVNVITLDQEADWLDRYSEGRVDGVVDPLNLAYVIYTSGSTGKPKGAGNSHAALANRLCWMQEAYGLDASDSVLQKTPFSFDVSVWEFFWPLLTGARLVVAAPGAHRDPSLLIETINRYGISTLHFVPSMLQAFIHEPGVEACVGLKRIVCSGEALPLDAQLQVFAKLPSAGLYNLYGPTEAAIDVTHWTCVDEGADSVPIGRPIANLRTHVLDAELLPVPSGVAGELYLGGAGLARSYHQRPALTAERFVPCPFHDGARLYRTGDRVRQRADGVIEYLGRLDHQVKLRGLRIELGEIETRLMQHPLVREAVVLVQGGKHLVGYLVLETAQADEQWQQDVKALLLGSLPEFMVPTYLLTLDRLPVTANGKLDRKALPEPDAAPQQAFVAPQDAMQKALAAIWEDVLGLQRVGLEDNFFELGGDSIISIQVVSRARQAGIRISPRDLFQYQTVRSLALVAILDSLSSVDQASAMGEALLGPIQQQFFSRAMPQREHWNQSLLLTPREALNAQWLDTALTHVINHHDALRLRFVEGVDGWQQAYAAQVERADVWLRTAETTAQLSAHCDEAQRSLDLANGPLLRAVLVTMADGSQRLSLILHHLVVDGVSWRVLLEDFQQAYEQLAAGGGVQLPARTSAFQSWTARLSTEASRFDDQLAYWKAQHNTAQDLPCERPEGSLQNRFGKKIEWRLDAERTRQLLQQAPAAYRTQVNDLLLTALARTISGWSGQPGTLIQLEGHGREDLFDDIDLTRSIGWFTSLFAVNLVATEDLDGSIKAIKEQLRAVPDKGLGYGVLRYLAAPSVREELAALPAPRITFNYLGQFDRQFDEQALLVPSTEFGGVAQDQQAPLDNWLTVEGQVYGGELSLSWGFSSQMFDSATVQYLVDRYAAELTALIEHCCALDTAQVTPSDFPLARISQAQLDALPVAAAVIEDVYPLSPMQQGMLFHTLYEPQVEAYISQMRLDIQGLDPQRFADAWQAALARHDVLRSSFHWQGLDSAHQVISRQVQLPLQVLENTDTDALAEMERAQGFGLDCAPLLRLKLVRTAADSWHLIYTSHHILMDGWSNAQLLGEVISHYADARSLPAPVGHYRDYMGWLQQQSADAGKAFWSAALAPLQAPTLLADAVRAPVAGHGTDEHREVIDAAATRRLGEFARQQKVTLNTLLQAAWSLLLQRYTGQDCVAFGATVAGRSAPLPGIEQQLGLFINTLPLVCNPRPDQRVGQWLSDLQAQNLALREFEHVPLYDIQGWAGHQGSALFDSLLVFENFPVAEALKQGAPAGLTFGNLHNHERTHYPLTLGIELGATLSLEMSYDAARFSAAQVHMLCANLRHLLEQLITNVTACLGNLTLLDAAATHTMLAHCQPPALQLQHTGLVHERIAAQAKATPQALAVQCGGQRLSYDELNRQANRLAHRLLASGAAPGKRIGLALRRGPQMIVSLLAVLKTGAAYVPLDTNYPAQRLAYMIEDSRVDLLLDESALLQDVPLPAGLEHLHLGEIIETLGAYPDSDPLNHATVDDLAYVIYTSGSTGQPKGVAIAHAALREFCQTGAEYSALTADDRVLQFATFSFDGFVEQCYPPLCVGAALIMRGDELWDVIQLAEQIVGNGVTLADLPAAYWFLLARECAGGNIASLGPLRQVHVGGEAMSVEGLRLWHEAGLNHVRLLNTYGPTEATVVSSVHDCRLSDANDSFGIPIGRAIPGRALYVLDCAGQLLPAGGVGELCIGASACLAQQYFDRPALTAERFLPDPFAAEAGARLYRSGDLARYNENGDLEYAGRIDHQVKIRGLRIEMGEIEACLQAQEGVHAAAVIAQDFPGGAQLVAYVVPEAGTEPATAQAQWLGSLKASLQQVLPDYMVPAHLLLLDALPLNNNGKLDRTALPKAELNQDLCAYAAPQTLLQVQLAQIWEAVLESGAVGLNDHFFERGGHSLLATQVISRVRQTLKLDVPMRTLFEQPTLQAFAAACATLQHSETVPMLALPRGDALALSYAQERQWFLWQLEPDSAAYHVPSALRLRGALDIAALQHSFNQLVARHEPLRTTFRQDDERTVQVVHAQGQLTIEQHRLNTEEGPANWVQAQIRQPFDLLNGPLLRVALLRMAADDHVLVITQHHIVSDGWSMQVMVRELMAMYAAECAGQPLELAALTLQYADFAQWQRQWMDAGERQRQLDYWRAQLGGEQPVLELPLDHSRPAVQSYCGARLDAPLESALSAQLQEVARREGVTMFMLLLASFQTLLHRYSGQDDIRVGVPIANRNRAETEGLIGFFVNTQVMRAQFAGDLSFRDLLAQTRQAAMGAQAHQDLPFEQLVEALAPERSLSHSPLFQVLFNHQRDAAPVTAVADLRIEGLPWDSATAQFDLTLDTTETAAGLMVSLTYASDLFEATTIARLFEHWQALLRAIVAAPQQAIAALPMLAAQERQQILEDWNATATEYPLHLSVQQLIEAQVLRTPDAMALKYADECLSYAQLNARANQLAHKLMALGVGPESLVGIAAERSIEMVVALLAVLKAGGAYVPLDPEYPQDRLAYMIEDSGVQLLLTQAHLLDALPLSGQVQTLLIEASLEGFASANPDVAVTGENLAYVIYTSGSTGKPKGAGNRHVALTNRLCWMQQAYEIGAGDSVLQKTPFSFDVSVWEFFWPLMTGARLVVAAPGDHRDPAKLVALINREHITTLHFVPSMLQAFLQDAEVGTCTSLQRIVCSGEALPADAQQQVFAKLPTAGLYNLYGPTEAAIDVTHWTCVEEGRDSVPIGQPIANLGCYILDDNLEPVPTGVLGELYLAGVGLARGYHQRPALTAERFAVSPFGAGERIYRTGDLARYRADGVIEYAGRIDHQVKLRGLRIELGEIEARLLEHANVREAAVLVIDGKLLTGYVVLNEDSADWRDTLMRHLHAGLPEYMVPNQWLTLPQMPLSPNGKLDRKALPKPELGAGKAEYIAPRNELEQRIAAVWADVLKLPRVGLADNFFELGGDSIISIQVVARARQAGIRFTPKDLFQYQTVQALAGVATLGDGAAQIDQGAVSGATPLLPFQQWFFAAEIAEQHHWNQSVMLKPAVSIEATALEQALQALVAHHDALRLSFTETASGWTANHHATTMQHTLLMQASVSDEQQLQDACLEAQRSFDLAHGPLLRGLLVTLADGSQRLLLAVHHLVVDGVSWRILLEDLQSAYQQRIDGKTPRLPARTSAFKHWAERLQQHAPQRAGELELWRAQLADAPVDLPCTHPQASLQNRYAHTVQTRLDQVLTRQLLQQAPAAYRTQVNDLLMTALARVICRWTGHASTLIQLEGHGREDLFDDLDLSRSVGWFTSLFPVRLTPAASLDGSIKQIKEQLRAIPDKGLGFGVLRYFGDEATRRELAALPTPRITFNYLGQFDSQFDDGALFAPASEKAGDEQSPLAPLGNWLELNGQVYGGELSLGWTFSREMVDETTIQRLADEYAVELAALVEHCCAAQNAGITPSDFPLASLNQQQLDALPGAGADVEDIYPLSPMQQGMLFHSLYEQGSGDYINQMRVSVEGLDPERLRQAWQGAVDRHAILRTRFVWISEQEQPLQIVQRQAELPFSLQDWRGRADLPSALDVLAQEQLQQGFDLLQAPLLRLVLVRTDDDRHEMIYTSHHILMDGWSNSQLLGEVMQRYAGATPAAPLGRYADYIGWLQRQDGQASERFWTERLADLEEPTHLARSCLDTLATAGQSGYDQQTRWLGREQTQRLGAFARQHKVTLNTVVQAAWLLLLQRYTGQPTVAFGATVAGRPAELPGVEQQVGLFINTLPVIATPRVEQPLGEWLQTVQALNLAMREFEYTPLADIQRWSGQRGEGLFDSLLVFENYPVSEALNNGAPQGLRFGQACSQEQTNLPLTVLVDLGDSLSLQFAYARQHFSAAQIEQISGHLQHLLQQMADSSTQRLLADLSVFDAAQHQAVLQDWNRAPATFAQTRTLPQLIEAQVRRAPQAIAVSLGDEQLSYGELNARANRLAHALIARGVGADVLVGLAAERSIDMIVGLVAILKAGGAYLPLDPQYPAERLQYMIEDSGIALLLMQPGVLDHLAVADSVETLLLGDDSRWQDQLATDPQVWADSASLAYVIYTSGSTGKPKGTLLAHDNVLRLFEATDPWFSFGAEDRWTLFHSYAFDFSVWEIFGALLHGGRLVIVPHSVSRSPQEFHALLSRERITVLNQTPSAFKQLMQVACDAPQDAQLSLRYVVFGGEALEVRSLRPWFERFGDTAPQLVNMYGITETTVHVTYRPLTLADLEQDAGSPLGEPIPDLGWYVLDADLQPVAKGCIGELHVSGAGLARGYLKRADLSALRFVPNPFGDDGARLYRTGDLARYRADGRIEYAGRIDHQVKIRGFRIELGEIEAQLLALPQIRQAVVLDQPGAGGVQLVAYLVADQSVELDQQGPWREHLRQALKHNLPDYMVPAHLLLLDSLPLTANGKLDRKALPQPDASLLQNTYVAPESELQQQIAGVWADVLKLERVGLTDNFFELGGHSLLATQVALRLRELLGFEVPLANLFASADLAAFSAAVQDLQPDLQPVHDVLAKSLEALNRLSADELEKLIS
ncbi:non-ribosomal peptide synthetase [Pseudomonas sp. TH06]|uniref:non-ribosomal peptide synthetase n=1 Tax=Pseudomonas sp. TH06 TaxID=2796372 RepID=UPI00191369EF|nr:non-ribosomal peptide synthetase [Pseudomonas sp. TH06]MBK5530550.1 non-ribosomal peptide synthetase [Pseudomonas sp. TH06]